MQRHKSVEKRAKTSKIANTVNRAGRSRINTAEKAVLNAKDKETATAALKTAVSVLDKSVKTGLIHQNKASNKKSSLSKAVNKLAK
ncbi:MAG: 30S ribosomal protein S20 [Chitinispirillaceae bacterium]|nr:30S ribosomal protein S20 [Chitinispirillaceae bacterium]